MKIPFGVKYRQQIESGEYKVETRDGRPARIVCWDRKSEDGDSIVALINDGTNELNYFYKNTGRFLTSREDTLDLLIIIPEPELTEFEKVVASWLETAKDEPITNEMIVDAADNLMFCARQQIIRGAELSEEDERIRKSIIRLLQVGGYMPLEDKEKAFAYLEKQKEKKPAEWSEEDTEMYINVASSLRGYACGLENEEHKRHIKKGLDWLENRFKSIRPSWKPSKEQMEALEKVIKCELCAGLHTRAGILQTLYDDLQKNYSYETKS